MSTEPDSSPDVVGDVKRGETGFVVVNTGSSSPEDVFAIINAASEMTTPFSGGSGNDDSDNGQGGGGGEEGEGEGEGDDEEESLLCSGAVDIDKAASHSKGVASSGKKQSFGEWYRKQNVDFPLVTRSVTMGLTYLVADLTAQSIELLDGTCSTSPLQRVRRTVGITAIGLGWVGPLLTVWFDFVDKLVPGSRFIPVMGRTALDQMFCAPFMIACIFGLATIAEGHSLADAKHKLETRLLPTWKDGLTVWVPGQVINQAIVPLKYRVIFQATLSYFWDTYLSVINHRIPGSETETAVAGATFASTAPAQSALATA